MNNVKVVATTKWNQCTLNWWGEKFDNKLSPKNIKKILMHKMYEQKGWVEQFHL
jgi:hypothetical protein